MAYLKLDHLPVIEFRGFKVSLHRLASGHVLASHNCIRSPVTVDFSLSVSKPRDLLVSNCIVSYRYMCLRNHSTTFEFL